MTFVLRSLFVSLILVLVIAIVLAVRQRRQLGSRASRMLVAGAVLLLLVEAMAVLLPALAYLRGADGGVSHIRVIALGWVSAVQLALRVAGVGLIVAAGLTRRPASG